MRFCLYFATHAKCHLRPKFENWLVVVLVVASKWSRMIRREAPEALWRPFGCLFDIVFENKNNDVYETHMFPIVF